MDPSRRLSHWYVYRLHLYCTLIVVPAKAQWFLGPNTEIRGRGYGSTEGWIGSPYNPLELNQFKLSEKSVIEFLDINKSDSVGALAQSVRTVLARWDSSLTSIAVGG